MKGQSRSCKDSSGKAAIVLMLLLLMRVHREKVNFFTLVSEDKELKPSSVTRGQLATFKCCKLEKLVRAKVAALELIRVNFRKLERSATARRLLQAKKYNVKDCNLVRKLKVVVGTRGPAKAKLCKEVRADRELTQKLLIPWQAVKSKLCNSVRLSAAKR